MEAEHATVVTVGTGAAGYPAAVCAAKAGPELRADVQKPAEGFDTRVVFENVARLHLNTRPCVVETAERKLTADALRVPTGPRLAGSSSPLPSGCQARGSSPARPLAGHCSAASP